MARNSAGTYSLPASTSPGTNPVIPATTITSTWANVTLGDVATELSDSLSRSGKGGMTAPLRTADGAAGAPAHSYTSETGSGWFRHAAGELRLAILGVYRIAATAALTTINSAASVLGTLLVSGKITGSAGAAVTGTLEVVDDGGTSKKVSVDAPTGLAADYALTLPTALPGSTLPVTLSAAGALATAQLVNAQQNFGTPSAATDVVIQSFLDAETVAVTSLHANLTNAPNVTRRAAIDLAWFSEPANVLTASGALTGATAAGNTGSATALFTIPSGYRTRGKPSVPFIIPIRWYDASTTTMRDASLMFTATDGVAYFHATVADVKQDLANGDILYIHTGAVWEAT